MSQGILGADVIGANEESFPLFRCPKCGAVGEIDREQFEGLVSIMHEAGEDRKSVV